MIVHQALKHYKSSTVRPLSTILQNSSLTRQQNLRPNNERKNNLSTSSQPPPPPTSSSTSLTLYQYAICPFCHKVKTLLSYASQSYDTIEVNPLNKRQIKELPGNDYRKVPIALIDGNQYNGSDDITSTLLNHHQPTIDALQKKWENSSMTMPRFNETTWTTFATDKLGTVLYPNICSRLRDSYDAFRYVDDVDDFSTWEKVTVRSVGSLAMYFAAGKIKSKHGIEDERKALDDALSLFSKNGLDGGRNQFASGATVPDLGDLSVFGTLRSIERLELMERILEDHETIGDWYERMKGEVYG